MNAIAFLLGPAFAVVEIGGDSAWLLIFAGVFVIVFAAVCAFGYFLLAKTKVRRSGDSTWELNVGGRLPVSQGAFDSIVNATAFAFSKPEMTPERKARLDGLARSREAAVKLYRILMIAVGLAGAAFGFFLLRDATPANMQLLPAAIVLLLSAGALLDGLIPSRRIRGEEPIAPDFSDRFKFEVIKQEPTTLTLNESDVDRAAQVLSQNLPLVEAARAAYPEFDRLGEFEKQALLEGLERSVKARSRGRG